MKFLERFFETTLWESRFVVLAAVVASLASSLAMFYIATADAWIMISHLGDYISPTLSQEARNVLRSETITHVVEIVDGYLLATIMLIFGLGLYELFISRIEAAEKSESSSNVLLIHSLDDLKARLAKVILMILIVKYFEHAIALKFEDPIDLLSLAAGIALIGLALWFSHGETGPGKLRGAGENSR